MQTILDLYIGGKREIELIDMYIKADNRINTILNGGVRIQKLGKYVVGSDWGTCVFGDGLGMDKATVRRER